MKQARPSLCEARPAEGLLGRGKKTVVKRKHVTTVEYFLAIFHLSSVAVRNRV